MPRAWRRYTALGDSLTAGRGDVSADGRRIGWARRLAKMLSGTTKVPCELTNLARDGASVADVLARQVGHVDPEADLVSVTVGMNDIRVARYTEHGFAAGIATLLDKLASTRATVLTCTLPDIADIAPLPPEHVEIARVRLRQASDVIRAESARTGAICLDIWTMGELTSDPMYFTDDRLHPNATGHTLLATAFADLLPRLAALAGNAVRPPSRFAPWRYRGRDGGNVAARLALMSSRPASIPPSLRTRVAAGGTWHLRKRYRREV